MSSFVKKSDLAILKSDVYELDIDKLKNVLSDLDSLESKLVKLDVGKLKPVPNVLSKPSDVVKNEVDKKDVYYELVKKVNAIGTFGHVKKMTLKSMRLRMKYQVLLAKLLLLLLLLLRIRYPTFVIKSRKQIMMQILGLNNLPHLIIINLRKIYLMLR